MRSVGARRGRLNLVLDKGARHEKPIGFECESNNHSQKQRNLSCVGFSQKSDVSIHTKPSKVHTLCVPPAASASPVDGEVISTTRERDGDHEAGQWCEELGEFIQAPEPALRASRAAANAWVYSRITVSAQ